MKTNLCLSLILLVTATVFAGNAEQEKAFLDKYKTAFEAKDIATLNAMLYTAGSDPMAVEFYKMMQSNTAGAKISKIELVDLTPEDVKKAGAMQEGPDGSKMKLTLMPVKKLKVTVATNDSQGSSSSSTENFIAEKDGKYVIPVPGPAK